MRVFWEGETQSFRLLKRQVICVTAKLHRYFLRYKPLETVFQFGFFFYFLHLRAVNVIPRVFWAHQYIHLLCIGVELKGPTVVWDAVRMFLWNLNYIYWFKIYFPSWSFDKPFSEKFGLDIWMSTPIQHYKNVHAYDIDFHDEFAPVQ